MRICVTLFIFSFSISVVKSQIILDSPVQINLDTTQHIDPSALLEINSVDKGVLVPRLSEQQKLLIQNAAQGLLIFQVDEEVGFWYYFNNEWLRLEGDPLDGSPPCQKVSGVFFIPSHRANGVGSTGSFMDPSYGNVSWVINDLVEDIVGLNSIHAAMKITYLFNDLSECDISDVFMTAVNNLNSDEHFSINIVGVPTDTSIALSIVRVDNEDAWSNSHSFRIRYFFD